MGRRMNNSIVTTAEINERMSRELENVASRMLRKTERQTGVAKASAMRISASTNFRFTLRLYASFFSSEQQRQRLSHQSKVKSTNTTTIARQNAYS